MALLGRRLSDDEVDSVARQLVAMARRRVCATTSETDLVLAITHVTDALPTTHDIARVRRAVQDRGCAVEGRVAQPS